MRAIFIDCTEDLARVIEGRGLPIPHSVTIHKGNPTDSDLIVMCASADVIFVEHTVISPSVLDACPSIKAIVFMGTGVGTYVDLDDAMQRGIEVCTTPGYGDRAVAEHALALLFSAARRVSEMDRQIRAGNWSPLGGLQLEGQKVAVVGMGGIGTCLADLTTALGMNVAGWNRTPRAHPAFIPNLDAVLEGANIVSLHLSLNAETEGLLDERRLQLPAEGFILVNTARAGLVEEIALLRNLETGRIGHAALDVFPREPLPSQNPYVSMSNVTLTAHAAYMTDGAYEALWIKTLNTFEQLRRS